MRLLHSGHGDELCRPAGAQSEPEPGRREACRERQSVPLRNLPEGLCGDSGCRTASKQAAGLVTLASGNGGLRWHRAIPQKPANPRRSRSDESFVFGIPQNGLQHKEREVPLDEPPPLPAKLRTDIHRQADRALRRAGEGHGHRQVHRGRASAGHALRAHGGCHHSPRPHPLHRHQRCREAARRAGGACHRTCLRCRGVARSQARRSPSRYPVVRYAGQPIAGGSRDFASRSPTMRRSW